MSIQLVPFSFQAHQLRVQADEQGNPWFCAKDACDILGYVNSRDAVKNHCKTVGVANRYIPELSNTYTFITEGNLYRLIIKSNKPEAEPFEAWVCDEVLPAIRKSGSYGLAEHAALIAERDKCRDLIRRLLEQGEAAQKRHDVQFQAVSDVCQDYYEKNRSLQGQLSAAHRKLAETERRLSMENLEVYRQMFAVASKAGILALPLDFGGDGCAASAKTGDSPVWLPDSSGSVGPAEGPGGAA